MVQNYWDVNMVQDFWDVGFLRRKQISIVHTLLLSNFNLIIEYRYRNVYETMILNHQLIISKKCSAVEEKLFSPLCIMFFLHNLALLFFDQKRSFLNLSTPQFPQITPTPTFYIILCTNTSICIQAVWLKKWFIFFFRAHCLASITLAGQLLYLNVFPFFKYYV